MTSAAQVIVLAYQHALKKPVKMCLLTEKYQKRVMKTHALKDVVLSHVHLVRSIPIHHCLNVPLRIFVNQSAWKLMVSVIMKATLLKKMNVTVATAHGKDTNTYFEHVWITKCI